MGKKFHFRRLFLVMLFPLGALLFYTAPNVPNFIERVYSNGIFKVLSQVLSFITGFFPFSLAEIGLYLLVLSSFAYIIYTIYRLFLKKRERRTIIVNFLINTLTVFSIVYFSFVLLWGLNYNRLPFSKIAGLNVQPSSVKDLAEVCEELIMKTNEQRNQVTENENGIMYLKNGYKEAFSRAYKGYASASQLYTELSGRYGSPKGVILSKYMSYTGISGIYCPFTAEANVDIDMPDMLIPSTACHEMAHQRGFAREDEANYIAYLTCKMHPDPDFRYSGMVLALIHSMNALYNYDTDSFNRLYDLYNEKLVRDLRDNSQYWKRFEGPVERATDSLNNAYLKANLQKDGVQSYGRMVDLLIAEYKAEHK